MNTASKIFRIFVVEDNPADVYLLQQALLKAGLNFELTVIDDGAEALQFIQTKAAQTLKPHLALLDLNLPGHSGIEILAAIRQNEELANIPVAVMTSSDALPDRTGVERLGVDRFITKPPDLAGFLSVGNVLKDVLLGSEPPPVSV